MRKSIISSFTILVLVYCITSSTGINLSCAASSNMNSSVKAIPKSPVKPISNSAFKSTPKAIPKANNKPTPKPSPKSTPKPTPKPTPKAVFTPSPSKEKLNSIINSINSCIKDINDILDASYKGNNNMMARILGFGYDLDRIAESADKAIKAGNALTQQLKSSTNFSKLTNINKELEKWYNDFDIARENIKKAKKDYNLDDMQEALDKMNALIKSYDSYLEKLN